MVKFSFSNGDYIFESAFCNFHMIVTKAREENLINFDFELV